MARYISLAIKPRELRQGGVTTGNKPYAYFFVEGKARRFHPKKKGLQTQYLHPTKGWRNV